MINNKDIKPYKRKRWKSQVITVSGGKGGIGKTFFAVNFAVELKNRGYRVLIFDADINLSNVNLLTNIDGNNSFKDFLNSSIPIESIIQKGVGGVDVIYVGDDIKKIFNIQDEEYYKIFQGLSNIESDYDYIIIDTAAGINELIIRLMLNSDRIIMLTNPDITALVDLYRVIKLTASKKRGLTFDIVVNKCASAENAAKIYGSVLKTVNQFNLKATLSLLGFILDDPKRVLESIQKRIPIVILHSTGSIKECFGMIVDAALKKAKLKRETPFFYSLIKG